MLFAKNINHPQESPIKLAHIYTALSIIFTIIWLILWSTMDFLRSSHWVHLPFHSTVETIGGLSAIWIAVVLFNQKDSDMDICFLLGNGFVCKGILDIFHAVCMPGESFIFLNSAASLFASILFSFIWLPRHVLKRYAKEHRWFIIGFIIISVSIGFRAVLFPEGVPHIIPLYEERFTFISITLNNASAILFLTTIPRWVSLYQSSGHRYFLLFLSISFLFGTSEIFFQYSDLWDGIWWSWHFIRLAANIITLWFLFNNYLLLEDEVDNFRKNTEIRTS
jgi:hypothetical protein